ncbi:hypothetical protein D4N35_016150 [Siminovitchia fortis]|uniref:Uncharacterized protein n=2 Tax=Siminovitchia fortis TaxID=254758 RepID=A0A443IJY9_9BACI|nr:hypothetical protein D4N35_016150 [Siminovitchia fortis]
MRKVVRNGSRQTAVGNNDAASSIDFYDYFSATDRVQLSFVFYNRNSSFDQHYECETPNLFHHCSTGRDCFMGSFLEPVGIELRLLSGFGDRFGSGLLGMKERLFLIEGKLEMETGETKGTKITIIVPKVKKPAIKKEGIQENRHCGRSGNASIRGQPVVGPGRRY